MILMSAKKSFLQGKLLKGSARHKVELEIAERILQEGLSHTNEFWDFIPSMEVMDTLLSNNVLVMVPCSHWIMFQSKPMEHVARELLYAQFMAEKILVEKIMAEKIAVEQKSQKVRSWW